MTPPIQTIDTHAHYFPQSYIDLVAKHGSRVGTTVTEANGATFIQVGLNLRTGPSGLRRHGGRLEGPGST